MIADGLRADTSLRGLAALLGRAPSTISREVRRIRGGLVSYRPFTAEHLARQRRRRHHRLKIVADTELGAWDTARLAEYWSSAQITRCGDHDEKPPCRTCSVFVRRRQDHARC
ncbi:helix-turn-helix domain-containing protein [Kocuria nitroreducens]|uniref:helix-turn-helix domain-containing protein n=1 Tax=Kocuria nitroreducens TaxID=3058914 RepID=UPI0036DBE625